MTAPEYVLYLRKSVGRAGIGRQRTTTEAHIGRLGGVIVAEFVDTDSTAYQAVGGDRPDRADFDRMLAVVRARPGLRIASWHADRLVRSGGDAELCIATGTVVETLRGGTYDLATATGRKHFRGDANEAQYEVDHLIERMHEQQLELAQSGMWTGGPRPFGYDDDGMSPRPPEDDAVDKGSRSALAGVAISAIGRTWNDSGLLTTRGNAWTGAQVRKILLRPRNAGLAVYRGQIIGDAKWPAIVDRDIWEGVRAMLGDPARWSGAGPRKYLLSGLLTCGICRGPMTSHGAAGKGRKSRIVYWCSRYRHVARDAVMLDEFVTSMIWARLSMPDAAAVLTGDGVLEAARIRAAIAKLDARKRQAGLDYARDLIDGDQVAIVNRELKSDRERLGTELALIQRRDALAELAGADDPVEVWGRLPLARQRAVVATLVQVTVHKAPHGRPPGWRVGMPYFSPETIELRWL